MKVLVDICHPAHFHFFKNPIKLLKNAGHKVLITSRDKDITVELIENQGWDHVKLCSSATSKSGLIKELMQRNISLYKLVKKWKPDVMTAIGGIFIAQVGVVTRVPSVVFLRYRECKAPESNDISIRFDGLCAGLLRELDSAPYGQISWFS